MSLSGEWYNSTLGDNFSSTDFIPWDLSIQWPAPIILFVFITGLTFLLGVPGNGAVVWVTGFKMKRGVHTVCFLNLAVVDLTYCLTLPLLVASYFVTTPWSQAKLFGMFRSCTININMSASSFLLTLISICRCLAVTRPIWFRQKLRLSWVCAACFVAWVLAFFTCLPHLLSEQIVPYRRHKTWAALLVIWAIVTFGLPFAIMATCYIVIARELRGVQSAKCRKPVRLMVTVVAAFVVCWLPNIVCGLLQDYFDLVTWDWVDVTFGLASFNSALNPLLYVFSGREFRQVFRRSLAASLHLAFAEECSELGRVPPDSTVSTVTRV
ncbi:C3a anaphylatoxin chemotactic receptor-like [Pristis pectinata]|uniref:C3a anaphylatoxin chemotactic receptor-like n=1 Tax=Pristis pectinata TaxID=685728 RepID=UPI00223E2F6E|nr:C3a anaphylatoxin chemotactic receptor-like [Pristis pectinata]